MHNMKKILLIIISIVFALSLSSCSANTINKDQIIDWTQETYEKKVDVEGVNLIKAGTLTVATSPDYAPYEFLDISETGLKRYQGADIFMANYLAQTLGLKLEIVESSFDGLITQLTVGKADIILSGLTYSPDRAENALFTKPYYEAGDGGQVLIVLADNYDKLNSKDNLNNEDIMIGAQTASVQEALVKEQLPKAGIKQVGKVEESLPLLKKGTIDAIALSYINAQVICEKNSDVKIIDGFKFEDNGMSGTMGLIKKSNTALKEKVDAAIDYMEPDMYQNWIDNASLYANQMGFKNSNFFVNMYNVIKDYGLEFLKGTGITLALSAITVIFGTIMALLLAAIRKSKITIVRGIGHSYVEFVRGVPLLLLLWLLYMIAPASWPAYVSVSIALFLNSGAYVAEIIRAGIGAVDKGQYEAARTLGLSKYQTMKKVILPQAVKKILPAIGNEFVTLIKETSLASVFFIGDLMTIKNNITSITYLSIEPFIIVGVIYFVLTFSISKFINHLEGKLEA